MSRGTGELVCKCSLIYGIFTPFRRYKSFPFIVVFIRCPSLYQVFFISVLEFMKSLKPHGSSSERMLVLCHGYRFITAVSVGFSHYLKLFFRWLSMCDTWHSMVVGRGKFPKIRAEVVQSLVSQWERALQREWLQGKLVESQQKPWLFLHTMHARNVI